MEAIEFAVAESPGVERIVSSISGLVDAGAEHLLPARLLPGGFVVPPEMEVTWVAGRCILSGRQVMVPLDSVALTPNATERLPFAQSSNGLAAGFTDAEATVHALCELVERDASTLWAMRSLEHCRATAVDTEDIVDDKVRDLLAGLARSGFRLRLFDLTTDLRVPVTMAFLWTGSPVHLFDVASGVCAHPSAERSVLGAVREAAQTRVSNIAGARDDIERGGYGRPLPSWIKAMTGEGLRPSRPAPRSISADEFATLPERLGGSTIVVPLSPGDASVSVVRLVSEALEDKATNTFWRPGPRAMKAMTAL